MVGLGEREAEEMQRADDHVKDARDPHVEGEARHDEAREVPNRRDLRGRDRGVQIDRPVEHELYDPTADPLEADLRGPMEVLLEMRAPEGLEIDYRKEREADVRQ